MRDTQRGEPPLLHRRAGVSHSGCSPGGSAGQPGFRNGGESAAVPKCGCTLEPPSSVILTYSARQGPSEHQGENGGSSRADRELSLEEWRVQNWTECIRVGGGFATHPLCVLGVVGWGACCL